MTGPRIALSVAVFAAVGLSVGWRSLDYDWHWDDLHLIRSHSAVELARGFVSDWDPEGRETKGLRPGTILFNDARARIFGESLRAHRVFLILLFAAYLTALSAIVERLGGPWWAGFVGGVVTLCAKNSFYHFLWVSDGIHLVPALLFTGATFWLLDYLERGRMISAIVSAPLLLMALATREDALALYAIVPLIGAASLWFSGRLRERVGRVIRFVGFLFITFVPFWAWRVMAIPRAPNFRVNLGVLTGPLTLMDWTICLSGQSEWWRWAFRALFGLLLIGLFRLPRDTRRHSMLWLAAAAAACLPGAVRTVPNLLLLPISFYAIFCVLVAGSLAGSSNLRRGAALALCAAVMIVCIPASRLEQVSMHANSTGKIYRDWLAIYSPLRFSSTPPARAARVKAQLARFGVLDDTFDFDAWQQELRARGRVGFIDDGGPFVPVRFFLTP
jgi:hypothetical protein